MQEDHDCLPLSSYATILKTVTRAPCASSNKNSIEHPIRTTHVQHIKVDINEPEPRPDMITIYRRLYMANQFNDVNKTKQPTQDQYAVRNIRL